MNHAIYLDLKGKFALITGASRGDGIGAATCRALAMQGANVLFTTWQAYDREQPHGVDENGPGELEQALLNSDVKVRHVEIDLAHPDSAAKVLDARRSGSACRMSWLTTRPTLAADGVHVENDPSERTVLAEIRRLRDSGATLRGIARELNHRAFRTRRGTAWRLESVARVVKQGRSEMRR